MGTVPRVIVVGAGLAGLACGRQLSTYNIAPLILEASDAVGGRIRTDVFDGYRLDRGFQVLLTGYPEAKRLLNYRTLGLKPFHPGACIQWQSRIYRFSDPLRRPLVRRRMRSLSTTVPMGPRSMPGTSSGRRSGSLNR